MREQLTGFAGAFPRNTVLLSLFEWADTGLRVVDETRQLLSDTALARAHDCVSSRVLAVQHELARGSASSTATAFERALASDACRRSVTLWTAYVRFCGRQRRRLGGARAARAALHRARQQCPWAKRLLMEAFATLAGDMEADELRAAYSTMVAGGMRVHVDLDEFAAARAGGGR